MNTDGGAMQHLIPKETEAVPVGRWDIRFLHRYYLKANEFHIRFWQKQLEKEGECFHLMMQDSAKD
jgi:hypothetical protein